jgi:hypothetical protein
MRTVMNVCTLPSSIWNRSAGSLPARVRSGGGGEEGWGKGTFAAS